MIGILLLMHAPLGEAFVAVVTHVFRAPQERLEVIDVRADQNTEEVERLAQDAIARLDDGSGVLVITDMVGGTPANCTLCLCGMKNIRVIAGVSLPMLLRAVSHRDVSLDEAVNMALTGGQDGAVCVDYCAHLAT